MTILGTVYVYKLNVELNFHDTFFFFQILISVPTSQVAPKIKEHPNQVQKHLLLPKPKNNWRLLRLLMIPILNKTSRMKPEMKNRKPPHWNWKLSYPVWPHLQSNNLYLIRDLKLCLIGDKGLVQNCPSTLQNWTNHRWVPRDFFIILFLNYNFFGCDYF